MTAWSGGAGGWDDEDDLDRPARGAIDHDGPSGAGPPSGGGAGSDMARGMSQASRGLAVALAFAAIVLVGWLAGRAVDGWLESEPWGQVVGTVAGWVLAIAVVYYESQRGFD